jgi:hypothetical protein
MSASSFDFTQDERFSVNRTEVELVADKDRKLLWLDTEHLEVVEEETHILDKREK